MNPNLFTLPVYGAGVVQKHFALGVPTKLVAVKPAGGDAQGKTIIGSGLYVGRVRDSLKDERGYAAVVWKGSGAVWESEDDVPAHLGREAIAGTLREGDGVRDFTLVGQHAGDESQILRIETGLSLPPRATEQQRKQALAGFMRKHGAMPEPHGVFALAPECLVLSARETEASDDQVAATEAQRLSIAIDKRIDSRGARVHWGRRYLFHIPKGAGILVKGAVKGVLFRVVNTGGKLESRAAVEGDLDLWHRLENDRVAKARKET